MNYKKFSHDRSGDALKGGGLNSGLPVGAGPEKLFMKVAGWERVG